MGGAQRALTSVRQSSNLLGRLVQYIPTEERYLITQTVDNVNIASNGIDVASFILDDAMEISDKGTTLYDKSIVDFNHILPSVVKLFVEEARSRSIVFRTEQPFN